MHFKTLAVTLILLLGTTLSGLDAKAISKRHVRRDWLIIPDAILFYTYEFINNISPKTGEVLADIAQTPILLEIRNSLIEKTAAISRGIEELQKGISSKWEKMKQKANKEQEEPEHLEQKENIQN
ncbi:apovitellenin-1-like isoform X1 [Lissotriton helveticus]